MISWQWLLGKNWQKAKKVLAEENTTLNSLKLQWWNLSYAHNSLKKSKTYILEEAEASESDRASLKAALQKLEAVVLKSEDTTKSDCRFFKCLHCST